MVLAEASLGVSGAFYMSFGLWWHFQVTKKFWRAQNRHTPFTSSVTFNCCASSKRCSVEGVVKVLWSLAICVLSVFCLAEGEQKMVQNEAMGQLTVFVMFFCSGICDILGNLCPNFVFPKLDYLVLLFCFNLQSIVLAYHTDIKDSWTALADTYAMFVATTGGLALLMEIKFPGYIWCVLARVYSTFVLGTWLIHTTIYLSRIRSTEIQEFPLNGSAYVMNQTLHFDLFKHEQSVSEVEEIAWVPMFFTWHCMVDLIILSVLWLGIYRCASRNCCTPGEEDSVAHFENRVHFDYHVISTTTDSDLE